MKSHTLLSLIFISLLLSGCGGGNVEEALNADTTEESASDLISYFEKADPNLKKLAKTASDALDQENFAVAVQSINQLRAYGAKLTADQFMVVSEAGVNIQNAMIEAAERGDKKAQTILNMQSAGRRN
ncbi:MAG: hypothetical protein QF731_07170 [Verrucomicrobiota bacterium]|jgi:ribosomal protein L9|nr:hypothetical protein [Verrucomicrobiota bacterium]MEE2614960.1 hypothetical protein [Verrucomicrobiota bacterium]